MHQTRTSGDTNSVCWSKTRLFCRQNWKVKDEGLTVCRKSFHYDRNKLQTETGLHVLQISLISVHKMPAMMQFRWPLLWNASLKFQCRRQNYWVTDASVNSFYSLDSQFWESCWEKDGRGELFIHLSDGREGCWTYWKCLSIKTCQQGVNYRSTKAGRVRRVSGWFVVLLQIHFQTFYSQWNQGRSMATRWYPNGLRSLQTMHQNWVKWTCEGPEDRRRLKDLSWDPPHSERTN